MKLRPLSLILALLLSMVNMDSFAHDIEVANSNGVTIYYVWQNDNTELAVSYRGSSYSEYSKEYAGNVVIPSAVTYNGTSYPVTSIGDAAFDSCSGLTSVTIGNSVTSIGDYAFFGCSGLTSITIPNSVTSIGVSAFYGCSGLTSVTIPESVTSIGEKAFSGCSGLTSVTIPESVTSIEWGTFFDCTSLTSVTIPNSVTSIGNYAFSGCSGLTSVTIGNSVTSIGGGVFYGCSGLTSVTIPNSVTSIGGDAFRDCSGLTSVTIPNSVTSIGDNAFNSCSSLTSVTIPMSVTSIEGGVFYGCSGLTSVTIPESVTSIGHQAFDSCSGLTSVTIPNSVTNIGSEAFSRCSSLTSVTIPNSVTSIGDNAFYDCSGLTKVIVNDIAAWCSISFGNQANPLRYAHHLYSDENTEITDLVLPNSVSNIGDWAFYGCSGLTSVIIPNSVSNIGDWAFTYCYGLTSVTIPNSVNSIGDQAFSTCSGLTSVTVENETPLTINSATFPNRANATLYVPAGCKAAYEAADYWKEFGKIVEIGSIEVTDISQLDNAIYVEKAQAHISGQGLMTISLKNAQEATAYQFKLKLPEGVTLATNNNGGYIYTMSERHDGHGLSITYLEESDVYSFGVFSGQSDVISGNDGVILNLRLNIADDVAAGDYPVVIKDARYSLPNGSASIRLPEVTALLTVDELQLGDVNNDGDIDIADAVCIVNHVVGKPTVVFEANVADANLDGEIDIADAVRIVNLVIGKINALSHHGIGTSTASLPEPE